MKECPVLFSGAMVRTILNDEKTQTRRVVKGIFSADTVYFKSPLFAVGPKGPCTIYLPYDADGRLTGQGIECPYGVPGDRLWVRESGYVWKDHTPSSALFFHYAASPGMAMDNRPDVREKPTYIRTGLDLDANHLRTAGFKSVPSIHMPRWASRLMLEVVSMRVERLNEISEAGAIAEGVKPFIPVPGDGEPETAKQAFERLWDSINGERAGCAWADAPWVWVVDFRRVDA